MIVIRTALLVTLSTSACRPRDEAPCQINATVATEIERVNMERKPAPAEGYQVLINGDFTAMMAQAPVLDPGADGFHEGNAAFWLETLAKQFVVVLDVASPEFQALFRAVEARTEQFTRDSLAVRRQLLASVTAFAPRGRLDEFGSTSFWLTNVPNCNSRKLPAN